jgi:hypothetical protein
MCLAPLHTRTSLIALDANGNVCSKATRTINVSVRYSIVLRGIFSVIDIVVWIKSRGYKKDNIWQTAPQLIKVKHDQVRKQLNQTSKEKPSVRRSKVLEKVKKESELHFKWNIALLITIIWNTFLMLFFDFANQSLEIIDRTENFQISQDVQGRVGIDLSRTDML